MSDLPRPEDEGLPHGTAPMETRTAAGDGAAGEADRRRPIIERVGLLLIAVVLAALFGGVALALVAGGELFLGVMAGIGCAMTVWVGGLTLFRG